QMGGVVAGAHPPVVGAAVLQRLRWRRRPAHAWIRLPGRGSVDAFELVVLTDLELVVVVAAKRLRRHSRRDRASEPLIDRNVLIRPRVVDAVRLGAVGADRGAIVGGNNDVQPLAAVSGDGLVGLAAAVGRDVGAVETAVLRPRLNLSDGQRGGVGRDLIDRAVEESLGVSRGSADVCRLARGIYIAEVRGLGRGGDLEAVEVEVVARGRGLAGEGDMVPVPVGVDLPGRLQLDEGGRVLSPRLHLAGGEHDADLVGQVSVGARHPDLLGVGSIAALEPSLAREVAAVELDARQGRIHVAAVLARVVEVDTRPRLVTERAGGGVTRAAGVGAVGGRRIGGVDLVDGPVAGGVVKAVPAARLRVAGLRDRGGVAVAALPLIAVGDAAAANPRAWMRGQRLPGRRTSAHG